MSTKRKPSPKKRTRVSKEKKIAKREGHALNQRTIVEMIERVDLPAHDAIPEEARDGEWETERQRLLERKRDSESAAKAFDSQANALRGKPLSRAERAERQRNAKRNVRDSLSDLAMRLADTLDDAEANLEAGIEPEQNERTIAIHEAKLAAVDAELVRVVADVGEAKTETEE